ncbi:hypothetical protein WA026_007004 [Henosepilachna vigintioctopunctata]|uniref:Uncharacterized protein n=1 Tax=Henosepilachna vigintioctopunctata TaxID=420089 RepID=A0AAW1V4P0_9CUCU
MTQKSRVSELELSNTLFPNISRVSNLLSLYTAISGANKNRRFHELFTAKTEYRICSVAATNHRKTCPRYLYE